MNETAGRQWRQVLLGVMVAGLTACGAGVGASAPDGTARPDTSAEAALSQPDPLAALASWQGQRDHLNRSLVVKLPLFVTLPGQHRLFKVATRIYFPLHHRKHVIQIALHGATYDGRYWEIPSIDGVDYSYAEDMAARGYPVVVMDQLGAGQSDKPDGDSFGLVESANVLNQVEHQIRLFAGHDRIVYVGHSNGSVTAIYTQGTYGGADGLITTGWDHEFRPLPVDPTDPALQAALSTPYVSIPAPFRAALFYYAPDADPAVIDYDNANLATSMPRKQFLDLLSVHGDITARGPGGMTPLTHSLGVTVPVLVQAGEDDFAIAPASVLDDPPTEAAFYAHAASFTEQKLPEIGHAYNAHLTHAESWDGIASWLASTFP